MELHVSIFARCNMPWMYLACVSIIDPLLLYLTSYNQVNILAFPDALLQNVIVA